MRIYPTARRAILPLSDGSLDRVPKEEVEPVRPHVHAQVFDVDFRFSCVDTSSYSSFSHSGKAAPLVFRRSTPETRMVRGDWNIPVPPATAERLAPDIALAPLVGWAPRGWRLGYGGGYFDRTLAALNPRPFTIGVGFQCARLATIFPQPHDIALDLIITEGGVQTERV